MSEVKHYFWVQDGMSEGGKSLDTYVKSPVFDRVTAELVSANSDKEAYAQNAIDLRKRVDALQALLTAADERADERADVLEGWLRRWSAEAGGIFCALKYETDAALKPAEAQLNQCDGCQAGIPVVNGAHRMGKPGAYPDTMSCTAKLYKP